MNQFDMENEQAFQIVHDNPRRRGVIRDVGYIINQEQAQRFAVYEAAQKRGGMKSKDIAWLVLSALAVAYVTVSALI